MKALQIEATEVSPKIHFDPQRGDFIISGISRPEDVRSFYIPVIEWCRSFLNEYISEENVLYGKENPLKISVKLTYFNSSSAKFLYDILLTLSKITTKGQFISIYWHYEDGDEDMYDAGNELSEIAEIPFTFIKEK